MKPVQAAPAGTGGFFVTLSEPKGNTTRKVEGTSLLVGRAEDCGLTIAHETLSRRHLTISLKNNVCWIEDHASSNGTFINGKRIPSHHPMRVLPDDKITMGQANVKLSLSTVSPMLDASGLIDIGAQSQVSRVETDVLAPKVRATPLPANAPAYRPREPDHFENMRDGVAAVPEEISASAERTLKAAQQKAAALVQAAENEAEKRVEEIYRRAHETQAKMDETYQRRLSEAYRASEQVLQKAQVEAQALLETARQRSTDARAQAEAFVQELRRKTEIDCERLMADAQKTARDLKEQRLIEGEEAIKLRQETLIAETKARMDERVGSFERDMVAQAEAQRDQLARDERKRRDELERELKHQVEQLHELREEVEDMRERRAEEQSRLDVVERENAHHREDARHYQEAVETAKGTLALFNRQLIDLRAEIDQTAQVSAESQAGLGRLSEERRQAEQRLAKAREQSEQDLAGLRTQLEETKTRLAQQEQTHLEELRLQTARQVSELERQLFDELEGKREIMTRELAFAIENLGQGQTPLDGKRLREIIGSHLTEQVAALSKSDAGKTKQVSLVRLRRRQKFKAIAFGFMAGGLVIFGGEHALLVLRGDESPMLSFVTNAANVQKAELEARKFNPAQTAEFKDSYVDNVVYTENFLERYTSDDFQQKLRRKLTPYMLKTWKVEEDKVIELLGISSTLVKTLGEKREAIHPDFVPQGLAKMKADEVEAVGRMKTLLGSSVRVESFRDFEKKFYADYEAPTKAEGAPPRGPSSENKD